jgi:hypothetical protein
VRIESFLHAFGNAMSDQPLSRGIPVRGEIVVNEAPPMPKSTVDLLDWLSFLMDRLVQVPGTKIRVGLNTPLMAVPVLGDIIPSMISFAILAVGLTHYRVPKIVAARMVFNSFLDAGLGWIPVAGDLFDVWFKADTRNVRLLQQYASTDRPPSTWKHWLFLLGLLGLFLLLVVLIVLGTMAFIEWFVRLYRGG